MIKVSELKDEMLDYWAGKADGKEVLMRHGMAHFLYQRKPNGHEVYHAYSPSTDWSQGGPLIDRMKPTSFYYWEPDGWVCSTDDADSWVNGETALIAAMRCFVGSKFGNEVDDS